MAAILGTGTVESDRRLRADGMFVLMYDVERLRGDGVASRAE